MRRRLLAAAVVAVVAVPAVATTEPAVADHAHSSVVSANPVDWTPHVLDGTVWSMALVGDTVVVGGAFTKVADSSRRQTLERKNIFAYGLRDGAIPFEKLRDVVGTIEPMATPRAEPKPLPEPVEE